MDDQEKCRQILERRATQPFKGFLKWSHLTPQEQDFLTILFGVRQPDATAWFIPGEDGNAWREQAPPGQGWFLPSDIGKIGKQLAEEGFIMSTISQSKVDTLRKKLQELDVLDTRSVEKIGSRNRGRPTVVAMRLNAHLPEMYLLLVMLLLNNYDLFLLSRDSFWENRAAKSRVWHKVPKSEHRKPRKPPEMHHEAIEPKVYNQLILRLRICNLTHKRQGKKTSSYRGKSGFLSLTV